jgi:cobalamin biosynthesis protein CobC
MDGGGPAGAKRLAQHGGRVSIAETLYPGAPVPWVDLSTGINPHPYRASGSSLSERARLPDPGQTAKLEQAAADAFGCAEPARVVALPGTELALRLLPVVLAKRSAVIVGPTYSSHADAWRRAGAAVLELATIDSIAALRDAVVVIVNPNNPDGALHAREQLLALHDAVRTSNSVLVVDEAFVDLVPTASICDLAGSDRAPHLVALRSFGKFYGLPGVRLGFVIGAHALTDRLRGLVGDWPVSADALAAGLTAYRDTAWAQATRTRLESDARLLDDLLIAHGFALVGGTSLYRLVRHTDAATRFQQLLRAGILTRPFDHDSTLLRFGLPGNAAAWRRLAAALDARS